MAFFSFILGSVTGLIAMLTSIFAYDANLAVSLLTWFTTGAAVSIYALVITMAPQAGPFHNQMNDA